MPVSPLAQEAARIERDLSARERRLLTEFDPERAIVLLDSMPAYAKYHEFPPALGAMWNEIEQRFGEQGFAAFQKVTMARLVSRFESRALGRRYTEGIRQCFARSFARILRTAEGQNDDPYQSAGDLLYKDLALCRQRMFPAGARLVEPHSVISRSIALRGGPSQFMRFLRLMSETRGAEPFYRVHTHLLELDEFNPSGWTNCCLRLADMLELHPYIKGMVGRSWFYDPALAEISPHLSYVRQGPQRNGAQLLHFGIEHGDDALVRSPTRRRLFEAGSYVPKSYAIVWSRQRMIAWAKRYRTSGDGGFGG